METPKEPGWAAIVVAVDSNGSVYRDWHEIYLWREGGWTEQLPEYYARSTYTWEELTTKAKEEGFHLYTVSGWRKLTTWDVPAPWERPLSCGCGFDPKSTISEETKGDTDAID